MAMYNPKYKLPSIVACILAGLYMASGGTRDLVSGIMTFGFGALNVQLAVGVGMFAVAFFLWKDVI